MGLLAIVCGGTKGERWTTNLGLTVLRVGAGVGMAGLHGMAKMPVPDSFVQSVAKLGFPMPEVWAWAAALAETAGAGFVALGLFTRPAAATVVATMGVAAFLQLGEAPWAQRELPLLYGSAFLVFLLRGAGPLSFDAMFRSGGGGGGGGGAAKNAAEKPEKKKKDE